MCRPQVISWPTMTKESVIRFTKIEQRETKEKLFSVVQWRRTIFSSISLAKKSNDRYITIIRSFNGIRDSNH